VGVDVRCHVVRGARLSAPLQPALRDVDHVGIAVLAVFIGTYRAEPEPERIGSGNQ